MNVKNEPERGAGFIYYSEIFPVKMYVGRVGGTVFIFGKKYG